MRIVFLGTGDIGLPTLDYLLRSGCDDLVGVMTQPDKPAGRKQTLTPPEVKTRALAAGVPVEQPPRIRKTSALKTLRSWMPDVIVVMAYGQILPKTLLEIPRVACLNLHASLLPRHRGAAPIQAAIRDGDATSGITVMHIAEGLDTGDIVLHHPINLTPDETGQSLHDRLALLAPKALDDALTLFRDGTATRHPQDETQATHQGKLTRLDGEIDWSMTAKDLERLIRAYHPWPGTYTITGGHGRPKRHLKVYPPTSVVEGPATEPPGTLVECEGQRLRVATGSGSLLLHQVQLEGKKTLPVGAFLSGSPLCKGEKLGN